MLKVAEEEKIEQIRNAPTDSIIIGKDFIVGKSLGAGSFGEICLGTNKNTGEYVAIKIVIFTLNK